MRSDNPTVSIGLPAYNAERYLREALDSILGQTYRAFELIVSDNASTDATATICHEYAARDDRVRYIRSPINVGAHRNFRRALELARGRYFKWAAHDDICHPTYLGRCVEVLDADPSVVLCHSRTVFIDAEAHPVPDEAIARGYFVDASGRVVYVRAYDPPRQLGSPWAHRRFRDVLLSTRWCFEIFGVIRTDALRRTSGFRESYYGADKMILAELSLLGRFAEVPEELFFRRCHPEQSTNLGSAQQVAIWLDPTAGRRLVAQRLLCLHGYLRSIPRADLPPYERLLCLLSVARLAVDPGRWKALLGRRRRRAVLGTRPGSVAK